MFAEERQNIIHEYIQKFGAITTTKLMDEFNVSIETVRRDLILMEKRGLLKRVHGGAVEISGMKQFSELKERNKEFLEEKRKLSLTGSKFVNEGDIIFVDEGSTAIIFSEVLKERFSNLTVITNSLDVFNILCYHKDFNVILCGGHFNKKENAFYGSLVLNTLDKIHVQKAFIFPSAVSIEFGICDYQEELCLVQQQILKHSDVVYVLADSSKFEKSALLKLDDMKNEYIYVTDDKLPIGIEKLYGESNITIFSGKEK